MFNKDFGLAKALHELFPHSSGWEAAVGCLGKKFPQGKFKLLDRLLISIPSPESAN